MDRDFCLSGFCPCPFTDGVWCVIEKKEEKKSALATVKKFIDTDNEVGRAALKTLSLEFSLDIEGYSEEITCGAKFYWQRRNALSKGEPQWQKCEYFLEETSPFKPWPTKFMDQLHKGAALAYKGAVLASQIAGRFF